MITLYARKKGKEDVANALLQDVYWRVPLGFQIYSNARVLPYNPSKRFSGGVCAEDGRFVDSSALHEGAYDGAYSYPNDNVEKHLYDAVFLGTWIGIYGHAITDNIKKLWFLFTDDYKKLGPNIDLLYCYLGDCELPAYFVEILQSLGINVNSLKRVEKVTEYRKVIIPDNSFILSGGRRFITDSFKATISMIVDSAPSLADYPPKIFLSRKKSSTFRDYGEADLADVFAQHGFKIIVPEEYSFLEQVSLFNHCRCMAATEGSIAHNAVFCRKGSELVILRKSDYVNTYQSAINVMNALNVTYIDAHHTINVTNPWDGPFFLWRTRYLNKYFGEKNREWPRWFSSIWYKYLIRIWKEKYHLWFR